MTRVARRARWVVPTVVTAAVLALATMGVAVAMAAASMGAAQGEGPSTDRTAAAADRPVAPATPVPDAPPVVTFLGDSWTEGYGSPTMRGYAVRTGERLGWVHHVLGVGGTGYVVPGAAGPFADRIDAALGTGPDVLVVQGSINDGVAGAEALEPAVVATLSRLADEADPATRIVVVGASHAPGMDRAVVETINGILGRTAADLGMLFVDPAVENWSDPADPAVWADSIHPNDLGYERIADRMIPLLRSVLVR